MFRELGEGLAVNGTRVSRSMFWLPDPSAMTVDTHHGLIFQQADFFATLN